MVASAADLPAERVRAPSDLLFPLAPLRRRVAGAVRHIIVGGAPPVRDLSVPVADDPGLFGPGSVTWRVHGDTSMLIGGIRALMLQSLHPLAMLGVAEHSDYRANPLGRLWNTSTYVGTTTFGTEAQARAAADAVVHIHERVIGVAADGTPYAANDPHLLLWVHHAMIDSFLEAYQRYGADRLDRSCADRYVAETAVLAELVGADEPARSVAELRAWMRDVRPELRATREAREALLYIVTFPGLPVLARPGYSLLVSAAAGLMPAWAQRALWLPVPPLADPLLVRPAATAFTRFLGWALSGPLPAAS
jgi:uncharacterized protein (DUF2236 family)